MKPDPHPWACDLSQLYGEVWTRLTRGVHDRHAPARHPTLATVTPEGKPQARTVVLRDADKSAGTLDIHTDLRSAKVGHLRVTPFAALHVWDTSAHLQLRLEAHVTILTSKDAVTIWATRLRWDQTPELASVKRKRFRSLPSRFSNHFERNRCLLASSGILEDLRRLRTMGKAGIPVAGHPARRSAVTASKTSRNMLEKCGLPRDEVKQAAGAMTLGRR